MVARSDAWVCSRSQGQPCGERRRRTTSTRSRIRAMSSVMLLVGGTIRRGLDLYQPFGVEKATHPDQRGHRLDCAENLAVRLADHAQTLPRLLVDVPLAHRRAVVRGRRAAADLDRRTNTDRARIADDGLPFAARGEDATRRHGIMLGDPR